MRCLAIFPVLLACSEILAQTDAHVAMQAGDLPRTDYLCVTQNAVVGPIGPILGFSAIPRDYPGNPVRPPGARYATDGDTPASATWRLADMQSGADRTASAKTRARWITFAFGVIALPIGATWNSNASKADGEMNTAYAFYKAATTTGDASIWRSRYLAAQAKGRSAARTRNVAYGAAGVLLGASLVFTVW